MLIKTNPAFAWLLPIGIGKKADGSAIPLLRGVEGWVLPLYEHPPATTPFYGPLSRGEVNILYNPGLVSRRESWLGLHVNPVFDDGICITNLLSTI
ncbi:hypothetical protein [Mucilaginibacter sp. SG564]|uniref:hypothetical protein n=1 Tax=Mucilaginibacter sp. SG564 TaxID=2587022 RepID=UPI00155400C3|nr:hypothetical protein [Mucilaginibacter sp. SG564]NOW97958.1 hypothetical protein [Mucilaginibacter sp. SG564]